MLRQLASTGRLLFIGVCLQQTLSKWRFHKCKSFKVEKSKYNC